MIRRLLGLCSALLLARCTNFLAFRQCAQKSKSQRGRIAGTVVSPS